MSTTPQYDQLLAEVTDELEHQVLDLLEAVTIAY
jgi:hypothetical protein